MDLCCARSFCGRADNATFVGTVTRGVYLYRGMYAYTARRRSERCSVHDVFPSVESAQLIFMGRKNKTDLEFVVTNRNNEFRRLPTGTTIPSAAASRDTFWTRGVKSTTYTTRVTVLRPLLGFEITRPRYVLLLYTKFRQNDFIHYYSAVARILYDDIVTTFLCKLPCIIMSTSYIFLKINR